MRALLFLFAASAAGCGVFERPLDVQVDVWNRTFDPIFLVDQLGKRLDVPACGTAHAETFRVNTFKVFTEKGEWFGSGEGNVTGLPWHRFIFKTSRDDPLVILMGTGPFPELPACDGHPVDLIPPSN